MRATYTVATPHALAHLSFRTVEIHAADIFRLNVIKITWQEGLWSTLNV